MPDMSSSYKFWISKGQEDTNSSAVPTTSSEPSSSLEGYRDFGKSDFGDWLGGTYGTKEQATHQSQLDYDEYVRNLASAKAQRDWEEYMSNTQVQRSMKDIEAAGLNPWLALQSAGFGGAVPSGASASSSAGQVAASGNSNGLASLGTAAIGIAALVKLIAKILK